MDHPRSAFPCHCRRCSLGGADSRRPADRRRMGPCIGRADGAGPTVVGSYAGENYWGCDQQGSLEFARCRDVGSDASGLLPFCGKSGGAAPKAEDTMTKRRWREATLALGMVLLLGAPSVDAEDYKLGIADRLKVKVQEWPDLNGEYAVTPDGVVSLPLIGNIDVIGLRLNDLTQEISNRLARRSEGAERPLAAAEIVQYRPFSIVGDVQRPGEYPYRPGLTVLQAISLAG